MQRQMAVKPFKQGDPVRVHPLGKPKLSTFATVRIISDNQRSIAIGFDHNPQFSLFKDPLAYHPNYGLMMFATRVSLWSESKSIEPGSFEKDFWVDIFGGGRYEIRGAKVAPVGGKE